MQNKKAQFTTQPAFTCSNLAIKTLEQGMNMFKVNNKDTTTTPFALKIYGIFVYDRNLRHERVKPQLENNCKNPSQKLHAVANIANYIKVLRDLVPFVQF